MSNQEQGNEMRMEDFESMLEESLKQPTRGATVTGTVAQIQGNDVIVNIGTKTEGVVDISELAGDVKVGDTVELVVVEFKVGGYMQLSRRMIDERSEWNSMKDSTGKIVKVKVESRTDKGYRGKINGDISAFIPTNHIDLKSRIEDPDAYIGKVLDAKILKLSNTGRFKSALVSPKECMLDKINAEKLDFFNKVAVGEVMKGVVKTLKEYGAFISLGDVDGFLHKSNVSWGRPRNPSRFLKEGDEVTVKILDIDTEKGKIEVGLKQLSEDPWAVVSNKYPIDTIVNASVIGRRRNGYIAEIEPGVDAFIPLEELSWLSGSFVSLKAKDMVEGRIVDYDDEHKRVVISVRAATENPWKIMKAEAPEGSIVKGVIKNITDFGLFINFGQAVDGLVRKGDISWGAEPEKLEEIYKVGDEVEVKILRIDEERERISLGIKQLSANPWRDLPKGAKTVTATVSKAGSEGITVTLDSGLEGFIPANELDPNNSSIENFKAGDEVEAAILKADQKEGRILLSIKKLINDSERKETKEYMKKLEKSEDAQSFGNVFRDKFNK